MMSTNTFEATIKLPSGGLQKVAIQSDNGSHAKQLLEMQYGKGNVINLHQR